MVVLTTQSEFGMAPPPQTPYSIITNIPGWDNSEKIRDGDMSLVAKIKHIYPRFGPSSYVAQFLGEVAKKTGTEGKGMFAYLNPDMWPYTIRHATNPHREEHMIKASDLTFKCVDVGSHRLYLVIFEPTSMFAVMESWGSPGVGISIRMAEKLLGQIDTLEEVPVEGVESPPAPTWTPETEDHGKLRERVSGLVNRAPWDANRAMTTPQDVFVYPTGMAAVYKVSKALLDYHPGTIVVLGVVFHNTHHHLSEESPHGFKHIGQVDDAALDGFEQWLDVQAREATPVSHAIVEVPGNPTLETPDVIRLKELSEKHGFVLIVDDTICSFSNADPLPYSDILLTSLTKSFSGLADVMGGSVVLNPSSPHHSSLSKLLTSTHVNEFFAEDVKVLLANSQEFLSRAATLNANAEALADYCKKRMDTDPDCVLAKIRYPSVLESKKYYDPLKRTSTPEHPSPGYGCLLTLDFESLDAAKAFHDNCGFYPSPHLGAHVTVQLAYNMVVWGRKKSDRVKFRELGVLEEGVRISVGLEKAEDLVDTVRHALDKAAEAKKGGYNV